MKELKFKKLENLQNFGIKREGNRFYNDFICCEFITENGDNLCYPITKFIISYTDMYGQSYTMEEDYDSFEYRGLEPNIEIIIDNENDRKIRENWIVKNLLYNFLNPKGIIKKHRKDAFRRKVQTKEFLNFNNLSNCNGNIEGKSLLVFTLTQKKFQVIYLAKGDNDSTIQLTETIDNYIFYKGNIIIDKYLQSLIPENTAKTENFNSYSTFGYEDFDLFKKNKKLTKEIRVKYDFEEHRAMFS